MSHSTVLVIGPDHEAQLAPFDENLKVDPYPRPESLDDLRRMLKYYEDGTDRQRKQARRLKFDVSGCVNEGGLPTLKALYRAWSDHELVALDAPIDGAHYGYLSTRNPKSRWDWYVIGGRWSGFFKLKAGRVGHVGESGVFKNQPKLGWIDQCRKGDVDFDGMRAEAESDAAKTYDAAQAIVAGRTMTPWSEFLKRRDAKELTIDEARDQYQKQDIIRAFRGAGREWAFVEADQFLVTREAYLAQARASAGVTFAVLKDGEWYERGKMGWFGCVIDEKDDATWAAECAKLVDALPDDALFTVVDVHI